MEILPFNFCVTVPPFLCVLVPLTDGDRKKKKKRSMGQALASAVCVILLSCALTIFAAALEVEAEGISEEPKIFQVTDGQSNRKIIGGWRLGTENQFQVFMKKYGKKYSTREEYLHRLGVFSQNMVRAAENQVLDPTAVHGVTPFSDLSQDEFENMFTGLRVGSSLNEEVNSIAPSVEVDGLPTSFDWRDKGAVTEVKKQGICGACWAFSTTGAVEGANFIATGKLTSLSEQQLVDCDHICDPKDNTSCDSGCGGGLMTNAYKYLMEAGGLQEEKTYPYTGKKEECKFDPEKIAVRVVNFSTIPLDENQIAAHLVQRGPLAVGLNAIFMQTYIGGVSCPLICGKKWVNHGVLLVGYGEKGFSILRMGYRPYWIIKNSWGKHWGEHGYYRLCKGHGMCGMNTMVSSVVTATTPPPIST